MKKEYEKCFEKYGETFSIIEECTDSYVFVYDLQTGIKLQRISELSNVEKKTFTIWNIVSLVQLMRLYGCVVRGVQFIIMKRVLLLF